MVIQKNVGNPSCISSALLFRQCFGLSRMSPQWSMHPHLDEASKAAHKVVAV